MAGSSHVQRERQAKFETERAWEDFLGREDPPPQFSLRSYFKFRDCMTDAAKLVKKLDFIKRKAVAHLRDAKACVVACERIILQLRRKEAIGQLRSDELAALRESAMTVSKVLAGFDSVTK